MAPLGMPSDGRWPRIPEQVLCLFAHPEDAMIEPSVQKLQLNVRDEKTLLRRNMDMTKRRSDYVDREVHLRLLMARGP